MQIIDGANDPTAHLHRRMRPQCDWCGAELPGAMPKPYWVAAPSARSDEHGHPTPEESTLRVYLCKAHRTAMSNALEHAQLRERDRLLKGQKMFPEVNHLRPVE